MKRLSRLLFAWALLVLAMGILRCIEPAPTLSPQAGAPTQAPLLDPLGQPFQPPPPGLVGSARIRRSDRGRGVDWPVSKQQAEDEWEDFAGESDEYDYCQQLAIEDRSFVQYESDGDGDGNGRLSYGGDIECAARGEFVCVNS